MKYLDAFSKLSVFTTNEIADLFASPKTRESTLSSYLIEGRLGRVKRGLYAAINPATGQPYASRYEIASKISSTAFTAYHTALEYHGIANQVFNTIQVCSNSKFSPFEYDGVRYIRISPYVKEIGILQSELYSRICVTDIERTIIDCIDRIELAGGLQEIVAAINACAYLNEEKLTLYLNAYGKNFLFQKAGYILHHTKGKELSEVFFSHCLTKIGTRKSYMVENPNDQFKFVAEWNLFVPQSMNSNEEK